MSNCQKPGCRNDPSDTYTDEHGNVLDLCSKHYYELVSGKNVSDKVITPSVGTGVGTDLNTFDEPQTRGVQDILERDADTSPGTTPCPDCGKPMGMVSWVGEKPSCHRCQDEPTRWMGILDPHTGEEIGPTMNEYTDTTRDDVKILDAQY